ncbi:MAG: flagellar protein FlaG [Pseudomonadales bacterium]|nr:flagellar protein FlaG [Pseudomonadales bacterium]MCP5173018.1 flagellar protein FlaG [Pseudomonadales bacterium]MCP5302492.1 flagellar protein FlaG [Pseudomonadales bacterium]
MSETAITALTSLSKQASTEAPAAMTSRQEVPSSGNVLPPEPTAEVTREDVVEAVSNITSFVQNITRDLQFQVDDVTGGTVVTVLDSETSEIVRQIPSEEVLAISRYITEYAPDPVKGLLMNSES